MPLKSWILQRMNRVTGVLGRVDLPPRGSRPVHRSEANAIEPHDVSFRATIPAAMPVAPSAEHLGPYAALIAALREELEHFVSSQLRLHLAIAERDRYLLTSIEVDCSDSGDGAELLRRFMHEFTPEQIKRYLTKDVIGHLRNASAIDLSQFAGLNADGVQDNVVNDEDAYADLLAELHSSVAPEQQRPYDVRLIGRWTETDPRLVAPSVVSPGTRPSEIARTPLAGPRLEIEIEDGDGARKVTLPAIVANRRYAIGKGEGCDIAVNGVFASRRHCEIWLESGAWWVADAGSTNGIRVESATSVLARAGSPAGAASVQKTIELVPGACIVLSALAQGSPAEYPRLSLRPMGNVALTEAPPSPGVQAPKTPVTPIVAPRRREAPLVLTATLASGVRTVALRDGVPLRVGRSRNQDLVVDWAHEGVSGHHVDIGDVDESGASVTVHGDNGVVVVGVCHEAGAHFHWCVGDAMVLGRASGQEPECKLMLARRS